MRFIGGPRQCGKTTLAKMFLAQQGDSPLYYNWDSSEVRNRYKKNELFVQEDLLLMPSRPGKRWVCFDEIHKVPKWKNILKGIFDSLEDRIQLIVTGSARLDMFHRAGDSLAGRYFLFHLLPLSLYELTGGAPPPLPFETDAQKLIEQRVATTRPSDQNTLENLLTYSGYPEPFLKRDPAFLELWRRNYIDRLVREDIRDITRIVDLDNVEKLLFLLPERVGSPLSLSSLQQDLLISHDAVKNYLRVLQLASTVFDIATHSRKLARTLTKAKKVYLHDWTLVSDEGRRFENYVACELLFWTQTWEDAGKGRFELRYVRLRDGKECDFLIVKDNKPWLLLEAKLTLEDVPAYQRSIASTLGSIPLVQVVKQPDQLSFEKNVTRVSAARLFSA